MKKKTSSLQVPTYGEKYGRVYLAAEKKFAAFPDLLATQKVGFSEFLETYMQKLFDDINPIHDIAGDKMALNISDIKISWPIDPIDVCKRKELTYWGIMTGKLKLIDTEANKTLFNKPVNIGIMPLMTPWWSYVINGVERVIISQIIRSYGIFYNFDKRNHTQSFKVIPERGSWLEVFTEKSGTIVVRVNNSRKFLVTALLRVFGFETDESIKTMFTELVDEEDFDYMGQTLLKDTTTNAEDAAIYIYNKIRPGEIIDAESALDYIKSLFLDEQKLYLGAVARRKINVKLDLDKPIQEAASHIFDVQDMVAAIRYLISLANKKRNFFYDDIDHLANRRIRSMGEILYAHLTPVMRKFVKSVKGKLSILNLDEQIKLTSLVNFKIIDNSIKSFFATSQLSQFLDQINPVAEIEHKRRITALGPGWLKKETATFEVRDVHQSHYGRICPIETPEGQNIWLVVYQSLYSKINEYGFIETPAMRVKNWVYPTADQLVNKIVEEDILDAKGKVLVKESDYIDEQAAKAIEKMKGKTTEKFIVRPYLTGEVEYISPEYDEKYIIADISTPVDEYRNILIKRVAWRHFMNMEIFHVNDITHVDINPSQIFSPNTSIIPFVDHDDAVRASMGTNMQRQAVPLVKPEAPFVGTGLEGDIAEMTYAVVKAEWEGEVVYVDAKTVKVKYKKWGTSVYEAITFKRSNQKTIIHQIPKVSIGQKVEKGTVLVEWPSVCDGEVALGKNLRVAFMPWEWFNYEDAVIVSQRLVKDDVLTSIHIDEYEIEVSDTKLGAEETTNDIPGVSLNKLRNLDEDGIIRLGAVVKWGDLLVGKISPKSEGELSPEEKLIQAIFWDKSKSFKDSSLYLPAGSEGKVIEVVTLDAKKGDNLSAGVRKKIKVYVAATRKIEVGDKLAGRHGNKGIISIVVPEEDMPFTSWGEPIDIILNPLGVVSRMNIGQALETQLWLIAKARNQKFAVPLFSSFWPEEIEQMMVATWFEKNGKMTVYDGRSGQPYNNKVTIWYMYILKLVHMVEDKIHARSVGPYSLITQQPLWGKARDGGQRFWEMEVWALEAYSAVYTLQEMLTIKSDDVIGRNKTYEAIVKWGKIRVAWVPESFNLVTFLFKWLNQNITPISQDTIDEIHDERMRKIVDLGLKGITWRDAVDERDLVTGLKHEDEAEEKMEMMESVVEELKLHGDIDE